MYKKGLLQATFVAINSLGFVSFRKKNSVLTFFFEFRGWLWFITQVPLTSFLSLIAEAHSCFLPFYQGKLEPHVEKDLCTLRVNISYFGFHIILFKHNLLIYEAINLK